MHPLFLVSGPSGSGKTTIMRGVMDNEVVSFTTRTKREGEVDGIDYHFITKQRFDDIQVTNGLIESSTYGGNHYGITKDELESKTGDGPAFAIVDFPGMRTLHGLYLRCVTIFLYATREDCKSNMEEQGRSEGAIDKRLQTHPVEIENRGHYDYVIRNVRGMPAVTEAIIAYILAAERES